MPRASTIQNRISDPINGVIIIGSNEKNISGPRMTCVAEFTATAIMNPRTIVSGVTTKVNVNVKANAR